MRELNWSLLGTLVVASAIVAWAGDILGMKLGKRRISFMKLRPKYTSRIISMLTGVGIAVVTLLAVSVTSESVRTALFSMRYVQSQITTLTAELQTNRASLQGMELELFHNRGTLQEKQNELQAVEGRLEEGLNSLVESRRQLAEMIDAREIEEKKLQVLTADNEVLRSESNKLLAEINSLRGEAKGLRENIQRLREGRIAALTGEMLAQGIIANGRITPEVVEDILTRLSEESRIRLAYRFGLSSESIAPLVIDTTSINAVKKQLIGRSGRYLLRLKASANAVEGEKVLAELEYFESKLIFAADTLLAERSFSPGVPKEDLEDPLYRMLREVNALASSKGVLREPITGNVGTIDSAEFLDAIETISNNRRTVIVQAIAAEDIYTEGPVKVRFLIK